MTSLHIRKPFELFFLFKDTFLLLDGCKYCHIKNNSVIELPTGTYLLQVRVMPVFYSNTIIVNEKDTDKTLVIKGFIHQKWYMILLLLSFILSSGIWYFTNNYILEIIVLVLAALVLVLMFKYSHNPSQAISIFIQDEKSAF
ncbi:MAG: hypothetical protein ACM3PX_06195 [Omnitrophica WOR_2 bacterium]